MRCRLLHCIEALHDARPRLLVCNRDFAAHEIQAEIRQQDAAGAHRAGLNGYQHTADAAFRSDSDSMQWASTAIWK